MPRWLVPAVAAAVVAPLVAAAVAQRSSGWHPVFDLAMTELRVRDVGGRHSPLIGLQGRIGTGGSHPGPISFYLLAPVYRLLGSGAFALQVSSVVLHAGAVVTALLVVSRRRSAVVVAGVGLLLILLVQGYGLGSFIEPWNPHLPVLWFVAFLVSAWAVVDGDLPMLVPAVLSASICAQTHVPYLAVTVGVGAGLVLAALVWIGRRRHGRGDPGWPWLLVAAGVGLVLWLPPLVDQAINDPGNLRNMVDSLGSPDEAPIGVRDATRFVIERMDAGLLVVGETRHPGTFVRVLSGPGPDHGRGLVTLASWVGAVAVAARLRHRPLLALHAVVATSAAVAVAAISRIYGQPWPYLMFWAFGIGALMVLAIVATAGVALRRWAPGRMARAVPAASAAIALSAIAAVSLRLLTLAPSTTTETPRQTTQLARIVPPTLRALTEGSGAASGRGGRYLVAWADATDGGSEGIGMVNELTRHGFVVGVAADRGGQIGPHRVLPATEATAKVIVASGGWIEQWSSLPGAVRVAYDDPRTAVERSEFAAARAGAIEQLEGLGREDLVEALDLDLFGLALNSGLPRSVTIFTGTMLDIGVPTAVFLAPAEATL